MPMNIFATVSDADQQANIRASWDRATAECRAQGRDWYPSTNRLVQDLAAAADLDPMAVVGIFAVLSPRSAWGTNVKNAAATLVEASHLDATVASKILERHGYERDAADLVKPSGLSGSLAKARAIADGESPATIVSGQKVLSFFWNIATPETSDDVTIDTWAAGVAMGRRLTTAEMGGLAAKQYLRMADNYRAVARELGIVPSVLQATTWCETRGRTR